MLNPKTNDLLSSVDYKPLVKKVIITSIFLLIFTIMVVAIFLSTNHRIINPDPYYTDENVWRNVSINWLSPETQAKDNKSPAFLLVNNLLGIHESVLYTRLLYWALSIGCMFLIYSMTKRLESFLYLLIPFYMDFMILYDTAFEIFLVLLAIKYEKWSGWFIGLSAILRPYSVIYAILLERKQQYRVLLMGGLFALLMVASGSFMPYLYNVIGYGSNSSQITMYVDSGMVLLWILFIIIGYTGNKKIFKWGLVASIPLILRVWGHYFIPSFTLFFMGFLKGRDNMEPKQKVDRYIPIIVICGILTMLLVIAIPMFMDYYITHNPEGSIKMYDGGYINQDYNYIIQATYYGDNITIGNYTYPMDWSFNNSLLYKRCLHKRGDGVKYYGIFYYERDYYKHESLYNLENNSIVFALKRELC